ncbi:MAG: hypothetical protein WC708_09780 [Lentisphaeria bacterium]
MKTITIDAQRPGTRIEPFWNRVICSDRTGLSMRQDVREQIALAVKGCGFRNLRQHGMFHDDMFVWQAKDKPCHFSYLDYVYDFYLSLGLRPFVELGFSPAGLASNDNTVFAARCHGCPPSDIQEWQRLVRATIRHLQDRYGVEETRTWYYEVWNEPNIPCFFKAPQEQYFDLYRATVETVKSVDSRLRIGGPATSNFSPDEKGVFQPPWVHAFLDYCQKHQVPVDFVSSHPYPTNFPFMPELNDYGPEGREADATPVDLVHLREIVRASAFPKAEIHCNEWSSAPGWPMHVHDHPFAGTFILDNNLKSIGLVDSLAHWALSDISEEAAPADTGEFKGGWGILTQNGIKKPSYHAYAFLNRLTGTMLHNSDGMAVCHCGKTWRVLLYNHHHYATPKATWATMAEAEQMIGPGQTREFALTLHNLPESVRVRRSLVDRDHGWARPAWVEMGSPAYPNQKQCQALRDAQEPEIREQVIQGRNPLELRETLRPLGMMLIEIEEA